MVINIEVVIYQDTVAKGLRDNVSIENLALGTNTWASSTVLSYFLATPGVKGKSPNLQDFFYA